MTLMRWNPLQEMDNLFHRFGPAFRGDSGREDMTLPDWTPRVDVSENENEFLIKAEVPGVEKSDVKVTVDKGVLTITGERRSETEEKGTKLHRVERTYGRFSRSFTLPENVDESAIRAEHKNGLLLVHLVKAEQAKPRSIEVKVA